MVVCEKNYFRFIHIYYSVSHIYIYTHTYVLHSIIYISLSINLKSTNQSLSFMCICGCICVCIHWRIKGEVRCKEYIFHNCLKVDLVFYKKDMFMYDIVTLFISLLTFIQQIQYWMTILGQEPSCDTLKVK